MPKKKKKAEEGENKKASPEVYEFRTIEDLHKIPVEKIEHFCQDLASWLTIHRLAADIPAELQGLLKVTTPTDVFEWIDDGKHDINLNIKVTG